MLGTSRSGPGGRLDGVGSGGVHDRIDGPSGCGHVGHVRAGEVDRSLRRFLGGGSGYSGLHVANTDCMVLLRVVCEGEERSAKSRGYTLASGIRMKPQKKNSGTCSDGWISPVARFRA